MTGPTWSGYLDVLHRILTAVEQVLLARPPASNLEKRPSAQERAAYRAMQRDTAVDPVSRYNPDAIICTGVPFGHTRPQWILPYGGQMTLNGHLQKVRAHYC